MGFTRERKSAEEEGGLVDGVDRQQCHSVPVQLFIKYFIVVFIVFNALFICNY